MTLSPGDYDPASGRIEPVHGRRLVRPPEVQIPAADHSDLRQLGIALFEYMLQVPANRTGHGTISAAQLKTIQEVISLTVFAAFSWLYLGEKLGWQHAVGFGLICLGAWFVLHDWT